MLAPLLPTPDFPRKNKNNSEVFPLKCDLSCFANVGASLSCCTSQAGFALPTTQPQDPFWICSGNQENEANCVEVFVWEALAKQM